MSNLLNYFNSLCFTFGICVALLSLSGCKFHQDNNSLTKAQKDQDNNPYLGTYYRKDQSGLGWEDTELIIHANGLAEFSVGSARFPSENWTIHTSGELHIEDADGKIGVYTLNSSKQLVRIADIVNQEVIPMDKPFRVVYTKN